MKSIGCQNVWYTENVREVIYMKKFDVTALGELLIDFTQNGISESGNWMMEANPGGAPCNVLSMLAKLGYKTSFIGQVGNDMFGKMLKERVSSLGIDVSNLVLSDEYNTTLAFVHTAPDGDRDFSFYRKTGADAFLKKEDVNIDVIVDSKILHYGTLSMTNEIVNETTEYALQKAKNTGVLLSFDPNLRPPLWNSMENAKERIWYGISMCDVLKIAQEELEFISGENDIHKGLQSIRSKYDIPLITVTKGKNGSCCSYINASEDIFVELPTFTNVKTIDTTGAGDTFCACVLHEILENSYSCFTKERLVKMLTFANAAASLITEKKGALCVMPEKYQIEKLMAESSSL